jgi:hypothetical protein
MQPTSNCAGMLQLLDRKKNGVPDETLISVDNCHPPITLSTAPPVLMNRFPYPNGSS